MSTTGTTPSSTAAAAMPPRAPRKPGAERVTGVIWGAIVATGGGFLIAALSGYEVDLELIAIVALIALGGWLLFSAIAVSMRERPRRATGWQAPDGTPEATPPGEAPAPRSEP